MGHPEQFCCFLFMLTNSSTSISFSLHDEIACNTYPQCLTITSIVNNKKGSDHGTAKMPKRDANGLIAAGKGPFQTRVLPPMPVEVFYDPPRLAVSLQNRDDQISFCFQPAPNQGLGRPLDAYSVRRAFLDAETSGEAMEFLSLSGFSCNQKSSRRNQNRMAPLLKGLLSLGLNSESGRI